jgi:putative methyltransferase (TIGR04325 family)
LRSLLKGLVPPLALGLLRRLRDRATRAEWEIVEGRWPSQDPRVRGWEDETVAAAHRRKWPDFVRAVEAPQPLGIAHEAATIGNESESAHNTIMAFAYVLALAARKRDDLSILDWGGGPGHYYVLARQLLPDVAIHYRSRDLPAVCVLGRELLPEAGFSDDDACLENRYDLVVASSSLNYGQDWQGLLHALAAAAGSYVYLARVPLVVSKPAFIVVQRPHRYGYDTEYPGWILNRHEVLEVAAAAGLRLLREFLVMEKPSIPGAPDAVVYRSFLFAAPEAQTNGRPGGGRSGE